ncbi:hypothetical protein [Sphingomonas sp. GM_Shp_2]|uniref:hypothetical protein n=1 Tax=Sphingomonas sp. GM_Shp_2 TaxID=2937380 RepID=UPI00226A66CB|nr:hypothetical protein [Sphingomonas sp. GM_Shp_2]
MLMEEGVIKPQQCDVFLQDKLNYFFVGRPAYKYNSDSGQADHWELPCVFIFESQEIGGIKRIFPFDSGAFAGKRYPSYIAGMPIENFEVSGADAPGKLIGAFFGSARRYLDMQPKGREEFEAEYSISPLDAELSAASRLAGEGTIRTFDDRRFSIEIQSEQEVHLASTKPIAVVIPEIYLGVDGVMDKIQVDWQAEALGYPMHSLSLDNYYGLIYKEVFDFYTRRGFI